MEMNLDGLNMFSLKHTVDYSHAKGLENCRECEPVAHEEKVRMRGTYLGVINEIGKGIFEGKMIWGQNLRKSRE